MKRMTIHPSITPDRINEAVRNHLHGMGYPGFCTACGADADGVEPDAERYTCEACEEPAVFGASELFFITDGGETP